MIWKLKYFTELTPQELYAIIQLRNEVFVVEQNCIFQDADNKDLNAHHLMGWLDGTLAAYVRILAPGEAFAEMSIGRVVTHPAHRKKGMGKLLMQEAIHQAYQLFGKQPIRIGAQCYLIAFYESLGFEIDGEVYDEDGIEHIEMLLST